jgi:hypothetical protein
MWKLADPEGCTTEWRLVYSDISNDEATALEEFFVAAGGSLQSFTFVDPVGNLLAWSEDLSHEEWSKGPLLSFLHGVPDAVGTARGWRITNAAVGPQSVTQDLAVPSEYIYCFSIWIRSLEPGSVTMIVGTHLSVREVGVGWRRITFANSGGAGADPVRFGLELTAGTEVEVFGFQVEAQPAASGYQPTTTGGVYENAHLRDDTFEITATGLNRNSCTVNIIHGKHT